MICTQNNARRNCLGSTKATSGDFLCCGNRFRGSVGPGRGSDPPHFCCSGCITIFSFEICSVRACQGFIPVETKRAEEPQTVRPGMELQERVIDHVTGKNTAPENVSLTAGYSEDGGKRRAERLGSDTRRHKTPFKRVMEALALGGGLWAPGQRTVAN
jgi:hypothetical protein